MTETIRKILVAAVVACCCTGVALAGGAVFISGDDSDDFSHCSEALCGKMVGNVLSDLYGECGNLPSGNGILAIGTNSACARTALVGGAGCGGARRGWNDPVNGGPGAPVTHCNAVGCISTVDFNDYRVVYVASVDVHTSGGMTQAQLDALNLRQADIADWVNNKNGRVLALTEANRNNPYGWLPNPLTSSNFGFCADNVSKRAELDADFPGNGATDANLDHACYHNYFTGPAGWSGLGLFIESEEQNISDPDDPGTPIPAPVAVGCCGCKITAEICDDGIDNDEDGLVDGDDCDCWVCGDGDVDPIDSDGDCVADGQEQCDDGNNLPGDGCDADCRLECPENPDPRTQGYWHRQCLGLPASEGGIDPGRNGRGPQSPTEPGFADELRPCAESKLEELGFDTETTCTGMDADPPSDHCEQALKQLTALLLNVCSGKLADGCEVDTSVEGCSSTNVGGLIQEITDLINGGDCNTAKACADAVNTGDGLVNPGGGFVEDPYGTSPGDDIPIVEKPLKPFNRMTRQELEAAGIQRVVLGFRGRGGVFYLVPTDFFARHGVAHDGQSFFVVAEDFDPGQEEAVVGDIGEEPVVRDRMDRPNRKRSERITDK